MAGNLDTADFVNAKKFARDYILKMDGVIEETLNVGEMEDMVINEIVAEDEILFRGDDNADDGEDDNFDIENKELEESERNQQHLLEAEDDDYRNYRAYNGIKVQHM